MHAQRCVCSFSPLTSLFCFFSSRLRKLYMSVCFMFSCGIRSSEWRPPCLFAGFHYLGNVVPWKCRDGSDEGVFHDRHTSGWRLRIKHAAHLLLFYILIITSLISAGTLGHSAVVDCSSAGPSKAAAVQSTCNLNTDTHNPPKRNTLLTSLTSFLVMYFNSTVNVILYSKSKFSTISKINAIFTEDQSVAPSFWFSAGYLGPE